ncbi:hypothetical protein ACFE04_020286 [Oxalis oulophora]
MPPNFSPFTLRAKMIARMNKSPNCVSFFLSVVAVFCESPTTPDSLLLETSKYSSNVRFPSSSGTTPDRSLKLKSKRVSLSKSPRHPDMQQGVGVGKGGVIVNTSGKHGKPLVYVGLTPTADPCVYLYAATETQVHDNPNVAKFFLEEDMRKGTTMNLKFKQNSEEETFLPRQVAENVTFSTSKLSEIFNYFSVKPALISASRDYETFSANKVLYV